MKKRYEAKINNDGGIETAHSVEIVCAACGFDLDEAELDADKCSDCGASLDLKQSVTIEATSVPAHGETLE
jgi:rRNA maturation endonuclease Nob1